MSRELLAQALDAMETLDEWCTNDMAPDSVLESASLKFDVTIAALRAALAQPAEPVAWRWRERPHESRAWGDWRHVGHTPQGPITALFQMGPLYAAPPAQPTPAVRVPLTDEQIDAISLRDGGVTYRQLARAIERAHGITGDSK